MYLNLIDYVYVTYMFYYHNIDVVKSHVYCNKGYNLALVPDTLCSLFRTVTLAPVMI